MQFPWCNAKSRWRSVDAHFIVLSIQHLLLSRIDFILIWLDRLSFCLIETQPRGKAERRNNLALFTLTRLTMMNHAYRFIAPAIHLFMNQYSRSTSYHSPKIYLKLKLPVKLHKAGQPLTHSVLLLLPSFVSPHFNCINRYQHSFSPSLWLLCWPNQSGHIWRGAHILLVWAFRSLNAIVGANIGFIVCCAMIFAVISIIQVAIPVQTIIGVRNAFRCAIVIAVNWMTVDCPDLVDI